MVVTEGQIDIRWKENKETIHRTIFKGSLVRVKESIHCIENTSDNWAEFTVFRMVPLGIVNRETIKNDKIVIEPDF